MRPRGVEATVTIAIATCVIAICAVAPLVALAAEGASANALDVLGSGATWALFARSLGLASAVTAIALAIGVPLGVALGRCDVIGARILLVAHAFPLFVPPFLLALGWFQLAPSGLFGPLGVVTVLGLAFAPIVTLLTARGLDGIDPSLEEAARVIAPPRRAIVRISLALARPSIALAAVIVFALAFSELGVPMFLRVQVYPAAVFARLGGIDYAPGEAFVLALPQLALAAALLVIERRWIGGRAAAVLAVRRDRGKLSLGRWRGAASIACALVVAIGCAPLAALAVRADWHGLDAWLGDAPRNSVVDAALAATMMTACGIVLGHARTRGVRVAAAIDAAAVFAFVTPAAALGAGLIAVWSRPQTQWVYATSAIIVVGYVARYAIFTMRPLAIAVASHSPHLEDAAATVGAGYLRRLVAIVIPMHGRAIAASCLLAMVFCLRDLETAVLYYPAGEDTLPVRIFTLEANGPPGTVAALATLHVAITAVIFAAGIALLGRRR